MNNDQHDTHDTFEWKLKNRRGKLAGGEQGDAGNADNDGEPRGKPFRLGVLVSGSGTNLQALIDAIEAGELPGVEIALVVSNHSDTYGLARAQQHKLQTLYLDWKNREESEITLTTWLNLFQVNLVVLAGWMRILSADFLARFPNRVINIHPALIPDDGSGAVYTTRDGSVIPVFRGLHAVRQALDAAVAVTGSCVHYVTPEVDAGPVICREEVAIRAGDTEESLHERLKAVEHSLIVQAVKQLGLHPSE